MAEVMENTEQVTEIVEEPAEKPCDNDIVRQAVSEMNKEIDDRIKSATFHAKFKTAIDIAERLVEGRKLSPEEIADATMVPIRIVDEMVENMNFSIFCLDKIREGNTKEIKDFVAERVHCDAARKMLQKGKMTFEEISEICDLPLEKVQELAAESSDSD